MLDPPKPPTDPVPDKNNHDKLLLKVEKDYKRQVEEKFGKIDLDHLDITARIETYQNLLKSKPSETEKDKKKPSEKDLSDIGGDAPPPEWERAPSFLKMNERAKKLDDFYNNQKSIGRDLAERIFNGKK